MKKPFQLTDHGMFLARTPLLPLAIFKQWAMASDQKAFVRDLYQNPVLMDALYLASPSLYDRYHEFFSAETQKQDSANTQPAPDAQGTEKTARQAEENKLYIALGKYLARAAYRCTPFGLFATVATGTMGNITDFAPLDNAPPTPRVRFDFSVQAKIVNWLLSDRQLCKKLAYQANNSISMHGNKLYFVEGIDSAERKQYQFNQVERETYLDSLLALAQQNTPYAQLQQHLITQAEVNAEEADAYLEELIASQILVPDLGICITGPDSFNAVLKRLEAIGEREKIAPLEQLWQSLANDGAIPPASPSTSPWAPKFDQIHHAIKELGWFELERKHLFQVDAKRNVTPILSQTIADRIATATKLLAQLTMRQMTYLDDFKRRFFERFEDKETPLDKLFNEEIGIPFPKVNRPISDLLRGIDFPAAPSASSPEIQWDAFHKLLFKKFTTALAQGASEIHISAQEADHVHVGKNHAPTLRGGVFAQAMLFTAGIQPDIDGANDGNNDNSKIGIYLQSTGGQTGVELLGRFCDLDQTLTEKVRAILTKQDQADSNIIHAEVVHLPQDRILNVVARPVLSEYEIPYLGVSGAAKERQIPVSDLMISLENNRFLLRSKRLNKQVIPRLTSAHNYFGDNLNLYQFLCCLASQDQARFGFKWPLVFDSANFLPRVSLDGVVVALATWRLENADIDALRTAQNAGSAALAQWRCEHKIPRFISTDSFDNVLPIDLENTVMVQVLLDEIGTQDRVEIREAIALNTPDGRECLGQHNVEVIMPMQVKVGVKVEVDVPAPKLPDHAPAKISTTPTIPTNRTVRPDTLEMPYFYPPGSEWVYFKIYCGQSQVDELLSQYLAPLMRTALGEGLIDKWFFIRYNDPEHHVRIRAASCGQAAATAVYHRLAALCQTALQDGFGWKVLIEGYDREVSRYGGLEAIAHCEKLFHLDSELMVDFINSSDTQIPVSRRWLFAVFCVTALLDAFGLNKDKKKQLVSNLAESFRREFHFGPRQKVQLGARYRSYRQALDAAVFGRGTESTTGLATESTTTIMQEKAQWLALIKLYQPERDTHILVIKSLADEGKLSATVEQIIGSLVHMHCNRLFIADQRAHEAVFYDFLDRIQESLLAADRVKGKSTG